MRKAGFVILAVTIIFTVITGVPKIQNANELKNEYASINASLSESNDALQSAKTELTEKQDQINSLRNSDVNPYSALEVTSKILSIPGIQNYTFDAYNSSETSGDVLIRTFTSSDELTFSSDINLINYKITASDITSFLNTLESYQLDVTSLAVHDQNIVDFSVKFIGGVE